MRKHEQRTLQASFAFILACCLVLISTSAFAGEPSIAEVNAAARKSKAALDAYNNVRDPRPAEAITEYLDVVERLLARVRSTYTPWARVVSAYAKSNQASPKNSRLLLDY